MTWYLYTLEYPGEKSPSKVSITQNLRKSFDYFVMSDDEMAIRCRQNGVLPFARTIKKSESRAEIERFYHEYMAQQLKADEEM